LVAEERLIVCVGSGGVGKTTSAASIALAGAYAGRRALVLTIDPARRLANSLGLSEFGNQERRIALDPQVKGELWAMMLDAPSTFDDVISRVAKDAATRDAIYANRIYRSIAASFSGSQEYMATERLFDVVQSGRYDLVVLDTPPVKNALDFLDAPGRLARFLDKQIMKRLIAPEDEDGSGLFGGRLLGGATAVAYRLLGHIFGQEFLGDIAGFFSLFRDLYDGFRERHEAVERMFADASTAFLIVAAPTEPSMEVAGFFFDELRTRKLPLRALVVNQVHASRFDTPDVDELLGAAARRIDAEAAGPLLARLESAHGRLRALSELEGRRVAELRRRAGPTVDVRVVPRIPGEVHDLAGLAALHRFLIG
jgi:anion-transporting  ArsA/GET3 family ATPase